MFPQAKSFFTDRMPLREQAVTANREISEKMFGTVPSEVSADHDYALHGKDGWLYLGNALDLECADEQEESPRQATAAWLALQRTLRDRGKQTLVVVPPDKSTIYPEHLPSVYPAKDCAPSGSARLWSELEGVRDPGFVPLRQPLLKAKRDEQQPVYRRKDSHWTSVGESYMVREILKALGGPAQMVRSDLHYVPGTYTGDLTQMDQDPTTDTSSEVQVVRPPDAPRVPGRTVIVGDSFALVHLDVLRPYFEDLKIVLWWWGDPKAYAAAIEQADTVILESVERLYVGHAPDIRKVNRLVSAQPGGAR